ncbi:hypothetical protein OGAPHI_003653 [Ogataea philodendri]|uniref:NAD-dependent protein deacetylase n=1 Tax=Ogataea philodendri TaxID=1378263 RepID=A0A9P8P5Q7_9ASCO|nr:uncharacterized protein OGAPHI_003653 [Ogataea philodendri]KAH3665469.1 hypothetical protein OGAPHI_003653 [Ogataea philodendri]
MDEKLQKLAAVLKRDSVSVTFFVGAGISTSCGIPDFRSPKTGLYSNLKKLNLPYPEAVFDIDYFRKSPKAFYTLADELYPGKFVPSKFHYFVRLCQDKKKLKRCYTQNIDTLERIAGVRDEYVVEAHGSFAKNHCIDCDWEMETSELKRQMKSQIPTCAKCKGYVKPDIVFFGEALPAKFFDLWDEDSSSKTDLAIVAGTSLAVYPFAGLPAEVSTKATRVLINREKCGDFERNPRKSDVLLLESCDLVVEKLVQLLGWEKELDSLVKEGERALKENALYVHPTEKDLEEKVKKEAEAIAKVEREEEKKENQQIDELTETLQNIKVKD